MQHARGFIVGCAKRVTLISWEAEHTEQQIGQAFYRQKTILSAYYIWVTEWLVTCLQSNPIGTNCAGFCSNLKQFYWFKRRGLLFKLRHPRAFQLSRGLLLGVYWLAGSRSPDGGGESHHFTGNRNPSPRRLPAPAPAAPHKLISQLQKQTRKISDTWIIDTDKRETRYQLVKVHQTIRRPHTSSNNTREDSTHGRHQMVNTEIRLIIFFAAKDGEVLHSQQKQDRELTVIQIMNPPNCMIKKLRILLDCLFPLLLTLLALLPTLLALLPRCFFNLTTSHNF